MSRSASGCPIPGDEVGSGLRRGRSGVARCRGARRVQDERPGTTGREQAEVERTTSSTDEADFEGGRPTGRRGSAPTRADRCARAGAAHSLCGPPRAEFWVRGTYIVRCVWERSKGDERCGVSQQEVVGHRQVAITLGRGTGRMARGEPRAGGGASFVVQADPLASMAQ